MGYGKMTHGEAVMIGMLFALQLSKKYAGFEFEIESLYEWLQVVGYQTEIPEGFHPINLIDRMKSDKKSVGQQIRNGAVKKSGFRIYMK